MIKIIRYSIGLLFIVGSISANASVLNAGFEDGNLSPWFQDRVFSSGEDWNVTNTDAHTGLFSATNTGNKEIRQNFAGVLTDSITGLSFWAKHDNTNGSALFVDLFYSDNTDTGFIVNTVGTGWEFFDVANNLLLGKTLVGFSIFGNSTGCDNNCTRTFLDDVAIVSAVPVPAAFWLFGSALLGFFGFSKARKQS